MKKSIATKSLFALLIALVLLMLVACGKSEDGSKETKLLSVTTDCEGMSVTAAELKDAEEGLVLEFQWDNKTADILQYGCRFSLEVKNGDKWQALPQKENTSFDLVAYTVYPESAADSFSADGVTLDNAQKSARYNISAYYELIEGNEYRFVTLFGSDDEPTSHKAEICFAFGKR